MEEVIWREVEVWEGRRRRDRGDMEIESEEEERRKVGKEREKGEDSRKGRR